MNINFEVGSEWQSKTNKDFTVTLSNVGAYEVRYKFIDGMNNECETTEGLSNFLDEFKLVSQATVKQISKATQILTEAVEVMAERGKTYDKSGGQERSMGKTVAAFNALTNHNLTEEQGWAFMAILKLARSQQGDYKADNYLDGTAYFALMGESAETERG